VATVLIIFLRIILTNGFMATLGMMYPARVGLVWGQMRGCYLKSGGSTPPMGSV